MKILNIFILTVLLLSTNSYAGELFTIKVSVVIKRPINKVFKYAGNTKNDASWRSEVHIIHSDGEFEVGTRYKEDAKLGKHKHYITEVELVNIDAPFEAVYITVEENKYYLKSSRLFEPIDENQTRFTYKVDIEKKMIGDIVGIQLPLSVIKPIYKSKMLKYMKKLKRIMEARNHHSPIEEL